MILFSAQNIDFGYSLVLINKKEKYDIFSSVNSYFNNLKCHSILHLRNKFNLWSVHGIMNPSGLVQSKRSPSLTLHETRWVHDSMNRPKINLLLIFTFYIFI